MMDASDLMPFASSRSLRALLVLYVLCSMTYFVAAVAAIADQQLHASQHVHEPFQMDADTMSITDLTKEAEAAGVKKGDIVQTVDGQPYRGAAQIMSIDRQAHPGEMLTLDVLSTKGTRRHVTIHLIPAKPHNWNIGEFFIVVGLEIIATFISLLVGYWVAAARPRDPNAWLILILLSFPEVLFHAPDWWTGGLLIFLYVFFQTLQIAGPLAVLLFGINFPETWRLDRRAPWLKWFLIVPPVIGWFLVLISSWAEYYHPALAHFSKEIGPWVEHTINPINLISVIVFWVALFDKLRSASTADARRRMKVLCAGSVIGLGSLLFFFVFLRAMGMEPSKHLWIAVSGALLSMVFPFSLAYVVIVQRAMDVRILLRMGTKYVLARATLLVLQIALFALFAERALTPMFSKRNAQPSDFIAPLVLGLVIFVLAYFGLARRLQRWLDRKFFREAYTSEVVLSELSEEARQITEPHSLISTISRRISDVLHVPQIGVLLRGGHFFQLQQSIGLELIGPLILPEDSRTVRTLIREKRPATLYRDQPDGWFAQAGAEERAALNAVNAEVLLPLPGREGLMGVMTLGPKRSEEPYSPSDLRLLQSVATQTGLALEVSELANSLAREAAQRERFNRELEIAREVQERLFPQFVPQLPGIALAGACRPAQGVGGDYYDFIPLENGRVGLAIGDVSGKGISAALLMASLRASLRGMTLGGSDDLAKIMQNVNQLVFEASANNRYATFFFAAFDSSARVLRYVNAGHNPPFLLRNCPDGSCPPVGLEVGGLVVGLLRDMPYQEGSVQVQPGDLLLAYTDGISEAMTIDDEEWGEERMLEAARAALNLQADQIVQSIFEAADRFTGGAPQHDDMTLLVMKIGDQQG